MRLSNRLSVCTCVLFVAAFLSPPSASAQFLVRSRSKSSDTAATREQLTQLRVAANALAATPTPDERRELETRIAELEQLLAQREAADSPLLPQAGVGVGKDTATVSLQAFEFFISNSFRYYLRSTLPLTSTQPSDPKTTPSEALRAGILDPFGGLLNTTIGYDKTWGGEDTLRVSFDARGGLKMLETPKRETAAAGKYEANPFLTGSGLLKIDVPLWRELGGSRAGTLMLAIGLNYTAAASEQYLEGLTDVKRATTNLTIGATIDLPGIFYIAVDGAPASNSSGLGKRFVVSVNTMRKKEGPR